MLLKNDVVYTLSEKEIKAVYTKLGWTPNKKNKPANFKIPDERYTFDKANNRKVRPSRLNIPLIEHEDHPKEGTIRWNYCERPPQKNRETGMFVYTNKYFAMTGDFQLSQDKIELLWFLLFKSSVRRPNRDEFGALEEGEKEAKSSPCFYVQNKGKEALAKLAKRELRASVEGLLLGKNAWPEEKIRRFAIAFGCDVGEDDSIQEVKATLLGRIEAVKDGYKEFAELSDTEGDVERLYIVNSAKKHESISFDHETNTWYFMEGGKRKGKITNGRGSMTPEMSLVTFIADNPDIGAAIEMSML